MKLESFDKPKKNKKKIITTTLICAVVAITIVLSSYALYEKRNEIDLINSTVRYPDAEQVPYTTDENEDVENIQDAIEDLYERLGD